MQGDVDAVELLQFGVYRGIELDDWYRILNIGFRFPCVGRQRLPRLPEARRLRDVRPAARARGRRLRRLAPAAAPRGGASSRRARSSSSRSTARSPARSIAKDGRGTAHGSRRGCASISLVAPVTNVQLIVNGRVVEERTRPGEPGPGRLDRARAARSS